MSELFAWEPAWRSLVDEVVMPALEDLEGQVVASGSVGIWLHGRLYRPPGIDGIRLIVAPDEPDAVGLVVARLADAAVAAGGRVLVSPRTPPAVTGLLGLPELTVPVTVTPMRLLEEAFDSEHGYWRWTVAAWVLAVEALARAGVTPPGPAAEAAEMDLMVLLEQVPDVLWTAALRHLDPAMLATYVDRPGELVSPELREVADLVRPAPC